jgi:hypothetical protein
MSSNCLLPSGGSRVVRLAKRYTQLAGNKSNNFYIYRYVHDVSVIPSTCIQLLCLLFQICYFCYQAAEVLFSANRLRAVLCWVTTTCYLSATDHKRTPLRVATGFRISPNLPSVDGINAPCQAIDIK